MPLLRQRMPLFPANFSEDDEHEHEIESEEELEHEVGEDEELYEANRDSEYDEDYPMGYSDTFDDEEMFDDDEYAHTIYHNLAQRMIQAHTTGDAPPDNFMNTFARIFEFVEQVRQGRQINSFGPYIADEDFDSSYDVSIVQIYVLYLFIRR